MKGDVMEHAWPEGSPSHQAWQRLAEAGHEYQEAVIHCIEILRAMPEGTAKKWARNSIVGQLDSATCMVHGGLTHIRNMVDDPYLPRAVTPEWWEMREEQQYMESCGPGAYCLDPDKCAKKYLGETVENE